MMCLRHPCGNKLAFSFMSIILMAFILVGCNFPPYLLLTDSQELLQLTPPASVTIFDEFLLQHPSAGSLFGEAISDMFYDQDARMWVQYFQKARLESSSEHNAATVAISDLGEKMLPPADSMVIIDENCLTIEDVIYPLCSAFRSFYENNQGEFYFGKPISHVIQEGNRFYQFFENVSLIYDPAAPPDQQVTLANLGEAYLLRTGTGFFQTANSPYMEAYAPQRSKTRNLTVYVAFAETFLSPEQHQQVYVQVVDQQGRPVEHASVDIVMTLPDGSQQGLRPANTNQRGISSFRLSSMQHLSLECNQVILLEVKAYTETAEGQTSAWFRIWE